MQLIKKNLIALSALALSGTAFAGTHTADFSGVTDLNSTASSFSYTVSGAGMDDITVTVSGWSDNSVHGTDTGGMDSAINSARLDKFGSGWGIDNQDERCKNQGTTISHAECGHEHSADNISYGGAASVDYDMFLISFSEDVSLTGADFSWLYSPSSSEISVAAISGALAGNLSGNTWDNVVSDAGFMWSDSFSVDSGTKYASIDSGHTSSQYWLLGAYNSVFNDLFSGGTAADDGLKLSSVDFKKGTTPPPPAVPEPHVALLFAAGLLGLRLKRRK